MSERYEEQQPLCTLYIVKHSLYSILERIGSQCSSCRLVVMCSTFVIWNVTDEPCGGVLDSLKWLECQLGKGPQHRVAVVQS